MAEEVIVFIHDGIVEGVFATSADMHVCIGDFDKDCGDQDCENARRADPRTHDLKLLWQKVPFITKKVPSKTTY